MSQGATDRYVHKEQTKGGVLELGTWLQHIKLTDQKQSGNRHGSGFSHERTQQWPKSKDRQPSGNQRPSEQVGDLVHEYFGEL